MENIELDELVYTYPPNDIINFQTLLSSKKEFQEVSALSTETVPKRGELFRHQKFIKRLMLQYDNQFLIHETGTGKSCSVIGVTEHYKKLAGALEEIRKNITTTDPSVLGNLNPPFKRVYILVKGQTLIDEMKFQILCKCTDGDYITDQILNSKTETARKGNITRSISKFYTITTYGTFAKELLKLNDAQLKNEFNNCIFIIDEVHNINDEGGGTLREDKLTGNKYYVKLKKNKKTGMAKEVIVESRLIYDQLWRLFHTVSPRKVILLSATPMINDPSELTSRMNLILPEDRQIPKTLDYKTVTLKELEPYFRGLISYVRSLDTGAIPIYQGNVIDATYNLEEDEEDEVKLLKKIREKKKTGGGVKAQIVVYATEMDDKQENVYEQAVNNPESLKPDSLNPAAFNDLERQAANFVFPDDTTGSAGYNNFVIEKGNDFKPTDELNKWISDPRKLRKLSAKFYEIVKKCKEDPGNCWCYSDFIRGSGAVVLGLCFEAQGFERFEESGSIFVTGGEGLSNICSAKSSDDIDMKNKIVRINKKLRFALLTSETSGPEAASLLEAFNSYENRHGEYIKAIIGSPVTRDGLNLANVLQIHLTGPGWNQASSYQAESRAIRSTSHVDLIQEEKERLKREGADQATIDAASIIIKVYRHAAIDRENTSIDLDMYQLSEIKDRQIKRIIRMMKQVSTDCQINYSRNVRKTDKDFSSTCDYDVCEYKCYDPYPENIDYSSYDVLYSQDIINSIKEEIIDIFRIVFNLSYKVLYSELSSYRKKFIDLAITELVDSKTPIIDRYGYKSYLREDRGSLFLIKDYPLTVHEKEGASMISEYSSNLLGISKMSLNEYNTSLQREENLMDVLSKADDFDDIIDNLTLENRIYLLETSIYEYSVLKKDTDVIRNIINKFKNFIFTTKEPNKAIQLSKDFFTARGKGRGRKPGEASKFKFNATQEEKIEKELQNIKTGDLIYFHNLSTAVSGLTSYAITAKSRKTEGKIRLLKTTENIGWRDATEIETPVYNTLIKVKTIVPEFEIYGTILQDGKFRIIDKTVEDKSIAVRDARKLKRGKVCDSGWKKPELFELLWKLNYNPFNVSTDFNRQKLIEIIVAQKVSSLEDAQSYSDDRLKFYYTWVTSGVNINKICELLEKYFEDNGKLFRE